MNIVEEGSTSSPTARGSSTFTGLARTFQRGRESMVVNQQCSAGADHLKQSGRLNQCTIAKQRQAGSSVVRG